MVLAIAMIAAVAMYFRLRRPRAGNAGNKSDAAEVFTVVNDAFDRPRDGGRHKSVDGTLPHRPRGDVSGVHQSSPHRPYSSTAKNGGLIEGYLDVGVDTDPGYSNVGLHGVSHGGSPGYYNAPGRIGPQQAYDEVDDRLPADQGATAAELYMLPMPDGTVYTVPVVGPYDETSPSNGVRLDQDDYVAPTQVVDGSRA